MTVALLPKPRWDDLQSMNACCGTPDKTWAKGAIHERCYAAHSKKRASWKVHFLFERKAKGDFFEKAFQSDFGGFGVGFVFTHSLQNFGNMQKTLQKDAINFYTELWCAPSPR